MGVNTKCIVLSFDTNNGLNFLEVKNNPIDRVYYNTFFESLTSNEFDDLLINELGITNAELTQIKFNKVWIEDILIQNPNDEFESLYDFSKLPEGLINRRDPKLLYTIFKKILNTTYKKFLESLKGESIQNENFNSYHSITVVNIQLLLFLKELMGILQVYENEKKEVILFFCEY